MSSILLRKLTKKSTLNFGKFKDYTVGHLFGMKKEIDLTSIYFKLSTISFTDEVLDELGITADFRISKPGKNESLYKDFMLQKYGVKQKPNKKLQAMRKETAPYRKDLLANINRGHR